MVGDSNGSSTYLPRLADEALKGELSAMGAVLIEGVKGCGKTQTARQQAVSEVLLDSDPAAIALAEIDPRLLLDGATPRLLDEWQRVPHLWDVVRRAVDDRRQRGQFILTGSATPDDNLTRHSGAGRFGILRMRTMTLTEKQATTPAISLSDLMKGGTVVPTRSPVEVRDYLHHIVVGGWPALAGGTEQDAERFLQGYLDIIIEHDVDEVSGAARNPRMVRRFLQAYAQVISQPATLAAITRRARDEQDTEGPTRYAAEPYLDALRRMMIVDEVPAWDPSVRSSKRLITAPKRHLGDPSLAAALLGMSPTRMLGDLETTGFLFESFVAHDLRVYAEHSRSWIYHYREAEGRLEVDYVLETRDGDWIGVEVKLGQSEIDKAADSLRRLSERVNRKPQALVVITGTSLAYTRDDGVKVIPLGILGP